MPITHIVAVLRRDGKIARIPADAPAAAHLAGLGEEDVAAAIAEAGWCGSHGRDLLGGTRPVVVFPCDTKRIPAAAAAYLRQ
jgi:hypothetical protein